MRELLKSGAVGNIELNTQKKIHEDIQNRWKSLGLVNGLEGHLQETVATLYENQAKHLIKEATASDNSGSFETVVFPLIRRVFSKLLANDIVSVQAMNLPIGKLFFIKPVTSEREWSYTEDGQLVEGKHHGLMGYERTDRNQNGAKNNRYYLPDECVNITDKKTMYVVDGVSCYFETNRLWDMNGNEVTPAGVTNVAETPAADGVASYLVINGDTDNPIYTSGTINVSPSVQELFEMTRLTKVFEIYDSEEDAIRSYESK